ncbi:hypothetical protein MTO96_038015 [Rhipicephalus appendiculatus]
MTVATSVCLDYASDGDRRATKSSSGKHFHDVVTGAWSTTAFPHNPLLSLLSSTPPPRMPPHYGSAFSRRMGHDQDGEGCDVPLY